MNTYYSKWQLDSTDWINRLIENSTVKPEEYILKNPGDSLVAEQLICYPKAALKLPTWHKSGLIYTKLSLEQSSGEYAARYKSNLVIGDEVLDLTGGLGIDTIAFSMKAKKVHHNEPDKSLSRIARNNHSALGVDTVTYHTELAEKLIETIHFVDTIYVDPSRRSDKGRTFLLADCIPDVTKILPILKQKSNRILIKLSPIYDLKRVKSDLPGTRQIHVVSVKGEVREILAVLDPSLPESTISVILPDNHQFTDTAEIESNPGSTASSITAGNYLHVADPAIYKAETLTSYSRMMGLTCWGIGGYMFSDSSSVIGSQSYRVIESLVFKPKELKKRLKGARVNIHKRKFPIEVDTLYKTLRTAMGDDYHLFFTTLDHGSKVVCITEPPVRLADHDS
jgi:hypothetical protein